MGSGQNCVLMETFAIDFCIFSMLMYSSTSSRMDPPQKCLPSSTWKDTKKGNSPGLPMSSNEYVGVWSHSLSLISSHDFTSIFLWWAVLKGWNGFQRIWNAIDSPQRQGLVQKAKSYEGGECLHLVGDWYTEAEEFLTWFCALIVVVLTYLE